MSLCLCSEHMPQPKAETLDLTSENHPPVAHDGAIYFNDEYDLSEKLRHSYGAEGRSF